MLLRKMSSQAAAFKIQKINTRQIKFTEDFLRAHANSVSNKSQPVSVELCPERNVNFDALKQINPVFAAVTWFFAPPPANQAYETAKIPALLLADQLCRHGYRVLLHLAAGSLNAAEVFDILSEAKRVGVRNILAVRGGKQ